MCVPGPRLRRSLISVRQRLCCGVENPVYISQNVPNVEMMWNVYQYFQEVTTRADEAVIDKQVYMVYNIYLHRRVQGNVSNIRA